MTRQISLISSDRGVCVCVRVAGIQEVLIYRNVIQGDTFNLLFWKNQNELDVCSTYLSVCEPDCAKGWGLEPERERSQRHTWSQKGLELHHFSPRPLIHGIIQAPALQMTSFSPTGRKPQSRAAKLQ